MPGPSPINAKDAAGLDRALLDDQLAELGRLSAMGMEIASAIHRRVTEDDGAASVAELQHAAIDFSRVARAVRLTFALQSRLIDEFKGRSRPPAGAAEPEQRTLQVRWIGQLSPAEKARRGRLRDVVRTVAESEGRDAETVERLVREAAERVEDDGIFGDIMTRPFGEIVALICRDLGLKPDWDALSGEIWAEEEIGAAAGDSPFGDEKDWREHLRSMARPEARPARAQAASP